MKTSFICFSILLALLAGCATMHERVDPDSSFILAYFIPPEGKSFGGCDLRPFGKAIAAPLRVHYSDEGFCWAENIRPGKYFIQSVVMYSGLGKKTSYFFGGIKIGGHEDSSFTVGADEVKFLGAFNFQETGSNILRFGKVKIVQEANITAKDCIKHILGEITAPTWKQRLTEELNRL